MKKQKWDEVEVKRDNGRVVSAKAPIIISASRSTDIPAFYAKWFMNRWRKGYVTWTNPFNKQIDFISFAKTRLLVFWSKNPAPILKYLPELDKSGVNYYFQFTVNDYGDTGLEPHVPSLDKRVETFKALSKMIGKERVIWRFDPLILTQQLGVDQLLERIQRVAELIGPFTEKLVISFADIDVYRKVSSNLRQAGIEWNEFSADTINKIARRLGELKSRFGLKIATCAENVDLKQYGIEHNRCIDDDLMVRVFNRDKALMDFLGYEPSLSGQVSRPYLKDNGQRDECGCIKSKDIGMKNTCPHSCVYCYANTSCSAVEKNCANHSDDAESIV